MKKILLTAAVIFASNSAFAEFGDEIYIKAFGGASKLNQVKDTMDKFKTTRTGLVGVAVGSPVMDKVRADISIERVLNAGLKAVDDEESRKIKTDINAMSLNLFVDLYKMDMVTFNVHSGVGIALVKTKEAYSLLRHREYDVSASSKQTINFAYSVGAGISAAISDGVNIDLDYSYKDFGKSKDILHRNIVNNLPNTTGLNGVSLKGHHVTAGIRFDM